MTKYEFRVAVLIPRGIGRPDPKTATKHYEIDAEDGPVGLGMASVEAIKQATEKYGDAGDYPYVVSFKEISR